MIYKFKSKATGDLVMTGPVGDRLLGLIGKEAASQGIIETPAMPAAIRAMEIAVSDDESRAQQAETDASIDGPDPGDASKVTLRQHVWPMIEMLKRAHAEGEAIVWGV